MRTLFSLLLFSATFLAINASPIQAGPDQSISSSNDKDNPNNAPPSLPVVNRTAEGLAPLAGADHPELIADNYMVWLHPEYTHEQHWQQVGFDLSDSSDYIHFDTFKAYAATIGSSQLNSIRADPQVMEVTCSGWAKRHAPVRTNATTDRLAKRYLTDRENAPTYGLAMIGAGKKLNTPVQDGDANQRYDAVQNAGGGVNVYVMDTGIRLSHPLFDGRASNFNNLKPTDKSPYIDEIMDDLVGHGTHVKIFNQKEKLDTPSVTKAMEDIYNDHKKNKNTPGFRGSVVNMSFGMPYNYWFGYWLGYARWEGVNFVASAGNDDVDTSDGAGVYPCLYYSVICVGAVEENYEKTSFSNWGLGVDMQAPGLTISSVDFENESRDGAVKMSGTSMAAPHVAGIMAIHVGWKNLQNGWGWDYVRDNSLYGICGGHWGRGQNKFATSGINDERKQLDEPFRGAGRNPTVIEGNVFADLGRFGAKAAGTAQSGTAISTVQGMTSLPTKSLSTLAAFALSAVGDADKSATTFSPPESIPSSFTNEIFGIKTDSGSPSPTTLATSTSWIFTKTAPHNVVPPTPSATPSSGCTSPNHADPLVHFTRAEALAAANMFHVQCLTTLKKGDMEGCVVYYNPCFASAGGAAIDVKMSVQQLDWKAGITSDALSIDEMQKVLMTVVDNCDTDTTTAKWGGYQIVDVNSGRRMYNVTGDKTGNYPSIDKFAVHTLTSGGGDCSTWDA
ncbi:hypothetical protein MRB53_040171 [Persea americana]|nr:hypothetical protein MRB53_040171 [Persea americana]